MSLLDTIQKGKRQLPPRILVYGPGGIGLSTLAAVAATPIFIAADDIEDCDLFPTCKSFAEIMSCLKSLKNEKHEYRTLVVDTLDWVEKLFLSEIRKLQETDAVVKSDGGFGQNDDLALFYWRQMAEALNPLREEKEMTVVLLAREKPDSQECTKSFPPLNLRKPAAALWCGWCDAVLRATFESAISGPENDARILHRDSVTQCNIKNRYNIPEVLPFRWSSLAACLASASDSPS